MPKAFLVRHAETYPNKKGIIQDTLGGEITPKGFSQVELLLEQLKSLKIDVIYSSDSERCQYLAERISGLKKLNIIYNRTLREIDNGEWVGKSKQEVKKLIKKGIFPKNGESFEDLKKRANGFLENLKLQNRDNIIVISHGCFIRSLLGILNEIPEEDTFLIKINNCSIIEVKI